MLQHVPRTLNSCRAVCAVKRGPPTQAWLNGGAEWQSTPTALSLCDHIAQCVQVNFPEKAGALRQFLRELMGRDASASGSEARLNVTMFHYRGTGNRSSSALVGLQVPLCP